MHCASPYFDAAGIESSSEAMQYARKLGVQLIQGDLMTHDFGQSTCDVVTLWDVFAGFSNSRRGARSNQVARFGGERASGDDASAA